LQQKLDVIKADVEKEKGNKKDFINKAKLASARFNQYQKTEYNTFVARCRTAKQWDTFLQEKHLFPNLTWIRSRSANPRELHLGYVGIILPQNHPFWQTNQPGNLWNCKCDWKTTDAQTTAKPDKITPPAKGLDGNPYDTGKLITENHPYFENVSKSNRKQINKYVYKDYLKPIVKDFTETIDANKGFTLKSDNIATGQLIVLRSSINKIMVHTVDNPVRLYALNISENFKKWEYLGFSEVDAGKHLDTAYFFYYKTFINNEVKYVNVKIHKMYKSEIPYVIYNHIDLNTIKNGMPADINRYIKK